MYSKTLNSNSLLLTVKRKEHLDQSMFNAGKISNDQPTEFENHISNRIQRGKKCLL